MGGWGDQLGSAESGAQGWRRWTGEGIVCRVFRAGLCRVRVCLCGRNGAGFGHVISCIGVHVSIGRREYIPHAFRTGYCTSG